MQKVKLSAANLILAPDAAVDLQVHTVLSDGTWTPEALIDHLVDEQFVLAAITDHDRVDTQVMLQRLAVEKKLPVVVAAAVQKEIERPTCARLGGSPEGLTPIELLERYLQ